MRKETSAQTQRHKCLGYSRLFISNDKSQTKVLRQRQIEAIHDDKAVLQKVLSGIHHGRKITDSLTTDKLGMGKKYPCPEQQLSTYAEYHLSLCTITNPFL